MDEFQKEPVPENQSTEKQSASEPKFFISPVVAGIIGLAGAFFLYQIVGGGLTLLIFGFDLEAAPVDGMRLMTIAGQVLFILLPALLFARFFYFDISRVIKFNLPEGKEVLLFILGMIILIPLLQNYLYIQNHIIEKLAAGSEFINSVKSALDSLNELVEKTYGNLLKAESIVEGAFVVLLVAIIPSICEETMFRGFIQKSFSFKIKPFWAAGITAVFFGLYHFNPYGILPLIMLGFYFGFAAYMSNSLVIPMLLHFLNNLLAVLVYFIFGSSEFIDTAIESGIDISSSIISFIFLFTLFAGVLFLIKRYYSDKNRDRS